MMCTHCNDTGVVETGNNDFACQFCPKGRTAMFNGPDGPVSGTDMLAAGLVSYAPTIAKPPMESNVLQQVTAARRELHRCGKVVTDWMNAQRDIVHAYQAPGWADYERAGKAWEAAQQMLDDLDEPLVSTPAKRVGYTIVKVLPELNGKHWGPVAKAYVSALRPSAIRVVHGMEKTDAKTWRVTVHVNEDRQGLQTISYVEQEVEVDLPDGASNGYELRNQLEKL